MKSYGNNCSQFFDISIISHFSLMYLYLVEIALNIIFAFLYSFCICLNHFFVQLRKEVMDHIKKITLTNSSILTTFMYRHYIPDLHGIYLYGRMIIFLRRVQ